MSTKLDFKEYISKAVSVKAAPMNLGEYNKLQGWQMPDNEDPAADGYCIETGVDGHNPYTWMSKARFDGRHVDQTGEVSDGYHTFDELYEFRMLYNACLFNEWARSEKHHVHKSKKHYDCEECFGGGWFIVVAVLPSGQISNHYEMKYWDFFKVPVAETAIYPFDGHSSRDVADRLAQYATHDDK